MRFHRIIIAAAVAFSAAMQASAGAADAPKSQLAVLVEACKAEAMDNHFRRFTTSASTVSAHRARMKQLCDEWTTVAPENRASLLARCRAEASVAVGSSRRANFDHTHVVRHRQLCEELAEAVGGNPN